MPCNFLGIEVESGLVTPEVGELVSQASRAPGPEGTQTWGKAVGVSPYSHKRLQ